MTDSVQVFPPGFRVTDANGKPVSGAKIKFYDAGTTDAKTVYSDAGLSSSLGSVVYTRSDGQPVVNSGSSTTVSVYVGTAPYKVEITSASDVTIFPAKDNVKGALDTSGFLTAEDTTTLIKPVVAASSNTSVGASFKGKVINGNATGGNFTLTLDSAATLGDGWNVTIRNGNASGAVIVSSPSAISMEGTSFTQKALLPGESITIDCDGAGLIVEQHTPPLMAPNGPGYILIVDRVSSSPSSPNAGDRYIVSSAFSTYATGDIIESNETGFNAYTPPNNSGWRAYVQDEKIWYRYIDTAWASEYGTTSQPGTFKRADQAAMEAASATDFVPTPATQQYHPSAAKLWINFNGTGTPAILVSSGASSLTDNGTGDWTVNWSQSLSSANYAAICAAGHSSNVTTATIKGRTANTTRILTASIGDTPTAADFADVNATIHGDL